MPPKLFLSGISNSFLNSRVIYYNSPERQEDACFEIGGFIIRSCSPLVDHTSLSLQPNQDLLMNTCSFSFVPVISCSRSSTHKPSVSPRYGYFPLSFPAKVQPWVRKLQDILMDIPETIKMSSVRMLDAFVDSAFEFADQPLLPSQSNFAPVDELPETVGISDIEGRIPDDFPTGVYIRNGPNPLFGGYKSASSIFGNSSHTWIEGEGMLHALYFGKTGFGSRKVSYNNRFVRSDTFNLEKERNKPAFLPAIEGDSPAILSAHLLNLLRFGMVDKYLSNTNIFEHSGKCYATAENHAPHEIDVLSLKTLGKWNLDAVWNRPFTSHPKKVPSTGELVIFGISPQRPYFELGILSADGKKILHKVDLKLNRCTLCHDFGVTERFNVILDFPVTIDINRLMTGGPLIRFDAKHYARIGVMPRYGDADSIRWFEVEPCTAFHLFNCFEDGDDVVVMACKARGSIIPGPDFGVDKFEWFSRGFKNARSEESDKDSEDGSFFSRAYEWRLNMQCGEVKGRNLTGNNFSMDFTFINEKFTGVRNKYGYTQIIDSGASSISGMAKYGGLAKLHFEERTQKLPSVDEKPEELVYIEYHKFPENTFCSGATFVPKSGSSEEDDGWIITFVHNETTNISQVLIIDARNFSAEPIAKITLPTRVPYGFHGTFVSIC